MEDIYYAHFTASLCRGGFLKKDFGGFFTIDAAALIFLKNPSDNEYKMCEYWDRGIDVVNLGC